MDGDLDANLDGGAFLLANLSCAVSCACLLYTSIILLVIAFLVSPVGLPMAAAWVLGKMQDLRYWIQDMIYG